MKGITEFKTQFYSGPDEDQNIIPYEVMTKAFVDMEPTYIEGLDGWYRVKVVRLVNKGVLEVTFTRGDQKVKE